MSIKKRFIILVVLLTTIPMIFSTIINIGIFHNKILEVIEKQVMMAPKNEAIKLENFFDESTKELKIIGNMEKTTELLEEPNGLPDSENKVEYKDILNEILKSRKAEDGFLTRISIVNEDGNIISSDNIHIIGKKDILSDDDIKKLKNNQVVVTDIFKDKNRDSDFKNFIIAYPIFNDSRYLGYTFSLVDMSYFKEIVDEKSFFETGKVIILDENGNVAASASDYIHNNINENDILYEKWNEIKESSNRSGLIEYKLNGVSKIAYYSKDSKTNWMTLTIVEWSEFITPLQKNYSIIIILISLLVVLIISSYVLLINYFSKPVYRLLQIIDKMKQGDFSERFVYNKQNEFGQISQAFNDLIDEIEINRGDIERTNRKLQSLISNIPGGVYNSRLENGVYRVDFISEGCLQILGYAEHEIKKILPSNLNRLIYKKDRDRVIDEFKEKINSLGKYSIEYRIVCKNGDIIWVGDNGQIIQDESGCILIYSVILDITKIKKSQKELEASEERHRIIMSQTDEIIFEYNTNEDTVYYADTWRNKFEYEPIKRNFVKNIYDSSNIYDEDKQTIKELVNDIYNGIEYRTIEIRIKKEENNYIWCRIRVTSIKNDDGEIYKVIGVLTDIDKEKRDAEGLLFKSQRDSLTKLYNKETTHQLIKDYINNEGRNGKHAFFIVDIDDFKSINDNFGHLSGDLVLSNISERISNIFRKDDIVGRIGGDEFVVFLKNADLEELINRKADELVKGFKESFIGENHEHKVSGSIGIARYPQDGKRFEELYVNADKALYKAKNQGRIDILFFQKIKEEKAIVFSSLILYMSV